MTVIYELHLNIVKLYLAVPAKVLNIPVETSSIDTGMETTWSHLAD